MSNKKEEKYSEKRRIGNVAEDIACMFLMKHGYQIIERNYLKKWGELDIIARNNKLLSFIEVKSSTNGVSRENKSFDISREMIIKFVSHTFSRNSFTNHGFKIEISRETLCDSNDDEYLPEDNVHFWKQKRMIRAIQSYLLDKKIDEDQEWQIDIITVRLDFSKKTAIIKHIQNVIFDI